MQPPQNPSTSSSSDFKSTENNPIPASPLKEMKSKSKSNSSLGQDKSENIISVESSLQKNVDLTQNNGFNPVQIGSEKKLEPESQTLPTNLKTSSKKKLIRVASKPKEVSGEEYLEMLSLERADIMKKSLSKTQYISEKPKTNIVTEIQEIEEDMPKLKSSIKEFVDSIEEDIPKLKRSIRKFIDSEEKNKEKEKTNADIIRTQSLNSSIAKYINLEENSKNKSSKSFVLNEQKPESNHPSAIRLEDSGVIALSQQDELNVNIASALEQRNSEEKEKEYERIALQMQGFKKPSLMSFIEEAIDAENKINDVYDISENKEKEYEPTKTSINIERTIDLGNHNNLTKANQVENEEQKEPVILNTVLEETSKTLPLNEKKINSSKKKESGTKPEVSMKISIIPPLEDEEKMQVKVSPKTSKSKLHQSNAQERRKSSLKPSSFQKEIIEEEAPKRSPKKSIVKFAEVLEISENKNPVVSVTIDEVIKTRSKNDEKKEKEPEVVNAAKKQISKVGEKQKSKQQKQSKKKNGIFFNLIALY